jgi:hypothetical protein
MSPQELFETWAPNGALWSPWAKPVLFVQLGDPDKRKEKDVPISTASEVVFEPSPSLQWLQNYGSETAIIINLPGAGSVEMGMQVAQYGFRPVPLYNCTSGPKAVVDVEPIKLALIQNGALLRKLPDDAPPAFLIDSQRNPAGMQPRYGQFDNRWAIFPQDFPSALFLKTNGIRRALVMQSQLQRWSAFDKDLYEVLHRWSSGGIEVLVKDVDSHTEPTPATFNRLSRIRFSTIAAGLTLLAFLSRRNAAGGFGRIIPEPSSGGS